MEISNLVLPLAIIVIVLVGVVYYFVHKERNARKKTTKLVHAFIQEKAKQQNAMNRELANLDKLLKNKSIDKETYDRLKNVLVTMNEKKGAETSDLLEYVTSKKE